MISPASKAMLVGGVFGFKQEISIDIFPRLVPDDLMHR